MQSVGILLNSAHASLPNGLYLVGIDDKWTGKPDVKRAFAGMSDRSCYVM